MAVDDRYSMSADKYIAKHNILVYLEDAVAQLLEHREENSKVNAVKFLSDYFSSVRDGNHTMFREYSYIHATPHNRASFVRLFWKCYRQIGKKGDLLSMQEYHSLLGLICPDFPFDVVKKTAKIILIDDALDCLISFTDFVYAFQTQLYYEEFLEKCSTTYQSLMQSYRSPREPVVVPTSASQDSNDRHPNSHQPSDGLDSMQFFRAIYPLCDKIQYSSPPVSLLKQILFNVPRISFYGFMITLAKSEAVNSHIGRLPPKIDLLEGGDIELTSSVDSKDSNCSRTVHSVSNPPSRTSTATVRPTIHLQPRSKSALATSLPKSVYRKPVVVESSSSETDTSSESSDSV